ncbi:MAG: thioredoxin-dependent thiol peroxidase [Paludibacteraceae bacterium]|jgi:peroxiredoxin Q/BCP|nr:thioredoxin-dependent thiol peroxidase [Paludibacteraceae bacterium]MEE0997589.1 thioredoxin-dependent thiol peroxidase [Paludibacteraceae bacterium]MEE1541111.1 thioredoxin-dependent thiol peroxidase [Paludibacteraceae bacterium]
MIKVGDKMPQFEVVDQDGKIWTSDMLVGKKTIVYFYPKDSTPGCTAEACNLRDNYEALQAQGFQIVGVSKDSANSHKKFIEKNELPFTLLSDKSTQMMQDFGAWGEKKMCGRVSIGTLRKTYVFDEQGVCTEIIDKVETKNHAAQILK